MRSTDYSARVAAILHDLEVPFDVIASRALPLYPEAESLELVQAADNGREHYLTPPAAKAWRRLHSAALADNVSLSIVSAFRNLERQAEIIRGKLACGLSFETIFSASAPPGYSEHHTGRAVDVTTPGVKELEVEFEATPAFFWLTENAESFGFALSFPRGNRYGFIYEPWHWCFTGTEV